jgi:tryptophan synthase alpha chain
MTHLSRIKSFSKIPVLAGFGISTNEHIKNFQQVCDGVVIGSKIVSSLERQGTEKTGEILAEILR